MTLVHFKQLFADAGLFDIFGPEALNLLFYHLEEHEKPLYSNEGIGSIGFIDPIELVCDYNEQSIEDILEEFDINTDLCINANDTETCIEDTVLQYLCDHTVVVGRTNLGFLYKTVNRPLEDCLHF